MMNQDPVILYVEDDAPSRRIMKLMFSIKLKLTSYHIFEDSKNFMERVEALDPAPDCIFLDIHVDPYSGFEMLEMLRTSVRFQNVPVVALTASVMNEEVQKLKQAGFNGCIGKPLDFETFPELVDMIQNGEEIWRILS